MKTRNLKNVWLPDDIKFTMLPFFSRKDLCAVGQLNKDYNKFAYNAWIAKLKDDLNYDYDASSISHPKLVYDQLNKEFNTERELFIKIIQSNKYFQLVFNELNNHDWDDEHIPFLSSIELNGYDAICRSDIVRCQLTDVSFDALSLVINQFITNSVASTNHYYKKHNREEKIKEVITNIENESIQFFHLFFDNPSKMGTNELKHCLRFFCSVNAHEIIRRFCNRYPHLVDFSFLLPEALASLNLDTVKVLVNAGADVNMNIMLYCDQDLDATIFGSPIYYPLLALSLGPINFLRLPPMECGIFRPDHPKLIDIMMYLFDAGANPEQSPIRFPWQVLELDLNRDDFKICHNFKELVKAINGNSEEKLFSKTFQDFLEKIENASSITKFNKSRTTLDEIKSFIQFVRKQVEDANSSKSKHPSSQEDDAEMTEVKNITLRHC